jgi:hypothetical protein
MLAEILAKVSAALIAITEEEVAEVLAIVAGNHEPEAAGEAVARALRRGVATRAGKMLSTANHKTLRGAHDQMQRACGRIRRLLDQAAANDAPDDSAARAVRRLLCREASPASPALRQEFRRRQADKLRLVHPPESGDFARRHRQAEALRLALYS